MKRGNTIEMEDLKTRKIKKGKKRETWSGQDESCPPTQLI